jgi:hypothetical protein
MSMSTIRSEYPDTCPYDRVRFREEPNEEEDDEEDEGNVTDDEDDDDEENDGGYSCSCGTGEG